MPVKTSIKPLYPMLQVRASLLTTCLQATLERLPVVFTALLGREEPLERWGGVGALPERDRPLFLELPAREEPEFRELLRLEPASPTGLLLPLFEDELPPLEEELLAF